MPVLVPNQTLASRKPTLLVENRLKVGRYQFRLEVVDNSGNISKATVLVVQVREAPVPPVGPVRGGGGVIRPDIPVRPILDQPIPVRPVLDRPVPPRPVERPDVIRPTRPIRPIR